jgi:putative FmdB family regulatory protein
MSRHEYFCQSCKTSFAKTLTAPEYAADTTTCPHCGSEEVEHVSGFYPIPSRGNA